MSEEVKVYAYITKENHLFVSNPQDPPEVSKQVPTRVITSNENPKDAVMQLACEKTGLSHLKLDDFLGYDKSEMTHRYFFHILCESDVSNISIQTQTHGKNERVASDLCWMELDAVLLDLIADHGQTLNRLNLTKTPAHYTYPGINFMRDCKGFMERWDNPENPDNEKQVNLHKTPHGNINKTGVSGDYKADTISRHQHQFIEGIEPGILRLVLVFINQFNWITYSSCQGHQYDSSIDAKPKERHIGLLSRDAEERQTIKETLIETTIVVNSRFPSNYPVWLQVSDRVLSSDDGDRAVIDLVFRLCSLASWDTYFTEIDAIYNETITFLESFTVTCSDTVPEM